MVRMTLAFMKRNILHQPSVSYFIHEAVAILSSCYNSKYNCIFSRLSVVGPRDWSALVRGTSVVQHHMVLGLCEINTVGCTRNESSLHVCFEIAAIRKIPLTSHVDKAMHAQWWIIEGGLLMVHLTCLLHAAKCRKTTDVRTWMLR